MKITLKKVFVALLTVLLIISSVMPCFAATNSGTITVTLKDKEKDNINGVTVYVSQIAKLNNNGYYPVTAFENSGISLSGIVNNPSEAVAKTVADYVVNNNVEAFSKKSKDGKLSFEDLDLGIWLVYCDKNTDYAFNPYIVFLPFKSGEKLSYEVVSAPKVDSNPTKTNIYVFKKWEDKNNAAKKRPEKIEVELLESDKVVGSVDLGEENGWSHTFNGMEKGGKYSVREKMVPNYKANYSGDAANGFVITNTYSSEKLPQTGQLWWPIGIIAVAGICFVILGIYEIGAKKNGEKK